MAREWFVTGTDTGVGKTAVGAGVLRAAVARGMSALGVKPVESGFDGSLGEDGARLREASSFHVEPEEITAYCLRHPLAPTVAAAREGRSIDWSRLVGLVDRARARKPDVFLVEGAGGLLVPMTRGRNMAEAAVELGMPLLIVARDGLGTINHTCLTVEAARARGAEVAGVILNQVAPGTEAPAIEENRQLIEEISGARVLGWVPHAVGGWPDLSGVNLAPLLGD